MNIIVEMPIPVPRKIRAENRQINLFEFYEDDSKLPK